MSGINKVILIGRAGKDPETRYSASGVAFTNLSIATSEKWKDKQTGEQKEKTEWHNLVFSARLAEVVGEYVKKGSNIYVEGKLSTRKWQDQSGQDRYTTEIKCFSMQMLDSSQASSNRPPVEQAPQQQYQQAPPQQAPQQYQQAPPMQQAPQQAPMHPPQPTQSESVYEDDIPFAPIGLAQDNLYIYCL